MKIYLKLGLGLTISSSFAFAPQNARLSTSSSSSSSSIATMAKSPFYNNDEEESSSNLPFNTLIQNSIKQFTTISLSAALLLSTTTIPTFASDASYDGFAEYAKDNQMEKSDVSCFMNKCGDQTKNLFSNPRGIKGVSCLGRCKGEQACSVRCFAEFGSDELNNWLSCTIEENECVKVPKNIDNSAEDVGYTSVVKRFDPKSLVGSWYKTDGLNPNYDLFDCQTNTFELSPGVGDESELDMGIYLRVKRPQSAGGGYWQNVLSEHMIVDSVRADEVNPTGRTMHTAGKMNGLTFDENWFILGESDGKGDIPEFKVIAYKGHTLQGTYLFIIFNLINQCTEKSLSELNSTNRKL